MAIEKQKDVYLCFIELKKKNHTVIHYNKISILQELGIKQADIRMITSICSNWEQIATVRIGERNTNWFEIIIKWRSARV